MDESGAVCKMVAGNELRWYNNCREKVSFRPFLEVIPEVRSQFRMRHGIDKIDLVMDGVSVIEMSEIETQLTTGL